MRVLPVAVAIAACYHPHPQAGAPCPDGTCPSGLVCSPASQTCELVAIDAAASRDSNVAAFRYRRRITIVDNATAALPSGFTIRVALAPLLAQLVAQGKVRSDFADLRVIGDGTLGERDRVIDPPNNPAPAAANFSLAQPIGAGATSTSYALYYGAPTAAAPPANGAAVFALYDDFSAGIAPFWMRSDGPIVTGGKLVLRANHTDALTTDAANDHVPIVSAVELVAAVIDPNSNPTPQMTGTFYYWFGYQHTGDFGESDPWILWIARGKGAIHTEQKSPVGCENECDGMSTTQDTAPHYYAIERDPGETRFSIDGAVWSTAMVTNTTDYSVMVRNFLATSDVDITWIRARARVSPDPTVTLGAEEAL
jgi:hypothetical protein